MDGGPEEALEWLRSQLNRWGEAVAPGDLILVGTPLGLYPVKPGDHVVVAVDDEKQVDCFIT